MKNLYPIVYKIHDQIYKFVHIILFLKYYMRSEDRKKFVNISKKKSSEPP